MSNYDSHQNINMVHVDYDLLKNMKNLHRNDI